MKSLLLGFTCLVFLTCHVVSAQQPKDPADVNGWNGSEWGMTPEKVSEAIAHGLGEPVKTAGTDPKVQCYDVDGIRAGTDVVKARYCFGQNQQPGLTMIDVTLGDSASYPQLRDDLKSKYGAPVDETHSTMAGGQIVTDQTKWLLRTTELRCVGATISGKKIVTITYSKRIAVPF